MIGLGLDLVALFAANGITSIGPNDYYGNTIPNGVGTGFNVGADGEA